MVCGPTEKFRCSFRSSSIQTLSFPASGLQLFVSVSASRSDSPATPSSRGAAAILPRGSERRKCRTISADPLGRRPGPALHWPELHHRPSPEPSPGQRGRSSDRSSLATCSPGKFKNVCHDHTDRRVCKLLSVVAGPDVSSLKSCLFKPFVYF